MMHHDCFGKMDRFVPVPSHLAFHPQITAPLLRYIMAYCAMKWTEKQPCPLNRDIARALNISERTVERLARQLASIDGVIATPVTRRGCKGWAWDLSGLADPCQNDPTKMDTCDPDTVRDFTDNADKNVQTPHKGLDHGLDTTLPQSCEEDPVDVILGRFDEETERPLPHAEFREGEREYVRGLQGAGYNLDEIAYGYRWVARHSYAAQRGDPIRSVRIVTASLIRTALRWRAQHERTVPGNKVSHSTYQPAVVDYSAIPRTDIEIVRSVCSQARATLKAARETDKEPSGEHHE